ncbi:MAG: DUF998 domain-containing protein [Dehalococcoidia bacterium]|nr:MAG: DUF998 domain-containing protein [Dehalococcoidia bacterium]
MTTDDFAVGTIAGSSSFLVILLILHLLSPEFEPSTRYISEYSLGTYGVAMRFAFVVLGLSVLSCAVVSVTASPPSTLPRYAVAALLTAAAFCIMGLAVFVTDPSTRVTATRAGNIHIQLAQTGFWFLVAGMIVYSAISAWVDGGRWNWSLLLTAAVALLALLGLRYATSDSAGMVQRLFIAVVTAWLVLAGTVQVRAV